MSPRFYLRQMLRESRGARGRMVFFIACLAVGVAAVVAVASLAESLDGAIQREARQLLAADVKVQARRPMPEELGTLLEGLEEAGFPPAERTDVKELVTVVLAVPKQETAETTETTMNAARPAPTLETGRSQLVELKVIDGVYPFYGDLQLDPPGALASLLSADGVVVAPDLLLRLHLEVGETLRIGGEDFRIAGTVLSEPDRVVFSLTLGPRVFLSAAGFDRTGLEQYGSRIRYKALLKLPDGLPPAEVTRVAEHLEEELPEAHRLRIESYGEAQPALRQGLARIERFLGLVALLSLLIGGIGVAQTVRAWLASRLDSIAVLKCLGFRPRQVIALYLGEAAALGLAGSALGAAAGLLVPAFLPRILGELVPPEAIRLWQPWALARGLGLGTGIAVLFSVPPLASIRRVPPVRVLRRDAEPLPGSRWAAVLTGLAVLAGVTATAAVQSGSLALGFQFSLGAAAVTLALAGAAWAITRLTCRLPRELRFLGGFLGRQGRLALRHGLAALGRPGAATVGAVVALGLGVMVVLAMSLVERHLTDQLDTDLPEKAPTAFLVDIQPDQWQGVQDVLAEQEATAVESVPVVMARLTSIDGESVEELAEKDPRHRWALTREQRLTYMAELPEDNRVVEGALWSDPQADEISVEKDFAGDIGVGVGSVLTLDVQGVPLELAVTSLRTVRWETFAINFFLVAEPGVLEEAPQFRIATARLGLDREQPFQDSIAAAFPNVTVLRIREILEKVVGVLDRLGLGVRFLGAFTVAAGLAILAGAVSAGSARRGREVALLKTLGVTRGGVAATFAVEHALVGLLAGAIGTAAGTGLAWTVVTRGMEIEWSTHLPSLAVALGGSALLTVAAGLGASLRSLARRPVEVLRDEA